MTVHDAHTADSTRGAKPYAPDLSGATPVMRQYLEIKAANPDSLLFYRMGDFYELFFDDAVVAARALGITLTKRGKHLGEDIPMCGVPVVSADDYLARLIERGFRVAVCEQLEDPAEAKKRGSKAVVRRDVERLVSAGTLTEDHLLDARRPNYLAAIAEVAPGRDEASHALAWIELSTGEFGTAAGDAAAIAAELARIDPSEVLVAENADETLWRDAAPSARQLHRLPSGQFDSVAGERRLTDYFAVATLDGFGSFSRAEIAAAGAILSYALDAQRGARPSLTPPDQRRLSQTMAIDAATRANLELTRTLSGERNGSLLQAIDRTVTAAGARLLVRRLAAPATDRPEIEARLDAVSCLVDETEAGIAISQHLRSAPDLGRAVSRLALGRGGPRDLAAIRDALAAAGTLTETLTGIGDLAERSADLGCITDILRARDTDLCARLTEMLVDQPPLMSRDGGFVRSGADADLDAARRLRDESRSVIADLEGRLRVATDVKSLKIKHNNFLGYHIEVSAQHGQRLIDDADDLGLIHRQTLPTAVRFSTAELGELEQAIVSAGDRALEIEKRMFDEMAEMVVSRAEALRILADALAELDVAQGFAALAIAERQVRPKITDGLDFVVRGGRHPVVSQMPQRASDGPFVANDCGLSPPDGADAGAIWIVTGPNMGGKSTFLRQNALIAIMAQTGAFVPAEAARIGIVDRLFSRVGAADDIARGRSTFMVEMVETAAILNQAGPRALVILDEIGRGTATFDGLSIAWAAIEQLHEVNRCRTLFATHFHELTALAERLDRLSNATLKVKEWDGEVVFLHEVVPGAADRSYGLQVARLAGLPQAMLERARTILDQLEAGERAADPRAILDDLPLFTAAVPQQPAERRASTADPVSERLRELDPDAMTPREALEALYDLKRALMNRDGNG